MDGFMGLSTKSKLFQSDEELGKKDDEYKPAEWRRVWRTPLYYRKRRVAAWTGVVLLLWLLFRYIGASPERAGRFGPVSVHMGKPDLFSQRDPSDSPPRLSPPESPASKYYYNGPLRFWSLPSSLRNIGSTLGHRRRNRNVLFVASSLKSASSIIPLACEMARWNRNYVHFAIMGRDSLALEEIREANGVDEATCRLLWHDARPDYSEHSTRARAEGSVLAAFRPIQEFMHPQVVVTDEAAREDKFFVDALKKGSGEHNWPVVEIPHDGADKLLWLSRLDTGSLKSWHMVDIQILVHAPPAASGSLIRLLRSLESADYAGLPVPKLIIELPTDTDQPTQDFLSRFAWPPGDANARSLVLRHLIVRQKATPEESSLRFIESFYPANAQNSHVFVLSPQAQLSPMYLHYLTYLLLEYKYAKWGAGPDRDRLFGLSLDVPSSYLNGSTPFNFPTKGDMAEDRYRDHPDSVTAVPYLWQAPNANAALFFGERWVEVHDFIARRVEKEHNTPGPPRKKLISTSQPAWLEYILELIRARGYSLVYPGIDPSERAVTIHNELYHPPPEFAPAESDEAANPLDLDLELQNRETKPASLPQSGPFIPSKSPPTTPPAAPEAPIISGSRPLHQLLPFDADLPSPSHLPYLDHTGALLSAKDAAKANEREASAFRADIGGCKPDPKGRRRKIRPGKAGDLFCFPEEQEEWDEEYTPMGRGEEGMGSEGYSRLKAGADVEVEAEYDAQGNKMQNGKKLEEDLGGGKGKRKVKAKAEVKGSSEDVRGEMAEQFFRGLMGDFTAGDVPPGDKVLDG